MELDDFYQQHYFHEADRKDQLNNAIAFPTGIVSVVGGAVAILAKELDYPYGTSENIQIILLVVTVFLIIVAIFFLAKSYWGYAYKHMPWPEEISKYRKELFDYYVSVGNQVAQSEVMAERDVASYIGAEYASNASMNAANNDKKSADLFRANGFMIASVVFVLFSAVPYVMNTAIQPQEVQKIELVNLKEIMMNVNTPSNQNTPPVPPVKPSPPPSRVIREHQESEKKG